MGVSVLQGSEGVVESCGWSAAEATGWLPAREPRPWDVPNLHHSASRYAQMQAAWPCCTAVVAFFFLISPRTREWSSRYVYAVHTSHTSYTKASCDST